MDSLLERIVGRYTSRVSGTLQKRAFHAQTYYNVAVSQLQAEFVGTAGEKLWEYLKTLHGRIGHQESFANIHGFHDWDYGNPGQQGDKWNIRVWLKSGGSTDWDSRGLDPNLLIVMGFSGHAVDVTLLMGNTKPIFSKSWGSGQVSASLIGLDCGAAWEKLLTGSVDYGD